MPRLTGDKGKTPLDPEAVFGPLADDGTIGLAVSGGPDSLALMLLAQSYAEAAFAPPRFIVYTVDHGLRPEAAAEVAFVAAEAAERGFACRVLRWSGRKPRAGLQEAARAARYGLIADAMRTDGANVLVTAHHLGDQAETVLMRLAHGSGLEGLRGMDYASEIAGITVVRPLLRTEPAALRALVEAAGIVPVADPSNADPTYERVRWRQLMPALAALGLDARRIVQFAGRVREADRALENMAAQAYPLVELSAEPPRASLERHLLLSIPRAVAVRLVAYALDRVAAPDNPRALAAVEALTDRLIVEPLRATLQGCLISSNGVTVTIVREPLTGARARARSLAAT